MKQLLLLSTIFLASCSAQGITSDSTLNTVILFAVIGLIVLAAKSKNTKDREALEQAQKSDQTYFDDFKSELSKNGITSTNTVTSGQEYGLAISDDLQSIATFNRNRELKTFEKSKLVSTECKINYNQVIQSKSKAQVVSWTPTENMKGKIDNTFASADLMITVNDLSTPLLKFRFHGQELAEKYNALVNLVIKNK